MAFWSLMSRVPWREVIRYAPHVIDRAERLVDFMRASRAKAVDPRSGRAQVPVDELPERVAAVEQAQITQAELLSQVAKEMEKVSEALRTVAARVTLALWLAGTALVLALAALLLHLR